MPICEPARYAARLTIIVATFLFSTGCRHLQIVPLVQPDPETGNYVFTLRYHNYDTVPTPAATVSLDRFFVRLGEDGRVRCSHLESVTFPFPPVPPNGSGTAFQWQISQHEGCPCRPNDCVGTIDISIHANGTNEHLPGNTNLVVKWWTQTAGGVLQPAMRVYGPSEPCYANWNTIPCDTGETEHFYPFPP